VTSARPGRAQPQGRHPIVLYDEDCGFCKWSLDLILGWDRGAVLRAAPIQGDEGARLLTEVPSHRHLDSWHLVEPSGRVRSGGDALAPLAAMLPGGRPLAALFAAFPTATERGYRWVAAHRGRLARLLRIDPAYELRRGDGRG
jgi:predicted DCC family thiol-disulfide oxidoreductase YuxK